MGHLLCVMKAITNFKSLLRSRSRTNSPRTSLFPEDADPNNSTHVPRWTRHKPKPSMDEQEFEALKRDNEEHATRLLEQRKQFLQSQGGNAGSFGQSAQTNDEPKREDSTGHPPTEEESGRTHGERHPEAASSAPALLGIGTGGRDNFASSSEGEPASVADSPTAVDFNVYDRAYGEEIERIKRAGGQPSVYMTWHLNSKDRFHEDGGLDVKEEHGDGEAGGRGGSGERGREKVQGVFKNNKFADLVSQTIRDTRARSQEGGDGKPEAEEGAGDS